MLPLRVAPSLTGYSCLPIHCDHCIPPHAYALDLDTLSAAQGASLAHRCCRGQRVILSRNRHQTWHSNAEAQVRIHLMEIGHASRLLYHLRCPLTTLRSLPDSLQASPPPQKKWTDCGCGAIRPGLLYKRVYDPVASQPWHAALVPDVPPVGTRQPAACRVTRCYRCSASSAWQRWP